MNKKNNGDNANKQSYILTKETLGTTILLFCGLVAVMLLTHKYVFGGLGTAVCTFMYGTFGYASYFILIALGYLGERLTFEKKVHFNWRAFLFVSLTVASFFLLIHSVTTAKYGTDISFGDYLSACFNDASEGYSGYTFGGVIFGLLVYPVSKVTTYVGAYVIFSLVTILFGVLSFLVIRTLVLSKMIADQSKVTDAKESDKPAPESVKTGVDGLYSVNEDHEIVGVKQQSIVKPRPEQPIKRSEPPKETAKDDRFSRENLGRKILFENREFDTVSFDRNMIYSKDDDSYFKHPVQANAEDYLSSFRSGTKKQEDRPTYTEDYSAGAENGEDRDAPSYLYGNGPASDLFGGNADSQDMSSYTVDRETAADDLPDFEVTEDIFPEGDGVSTDGIASFDAVEEEQKPQEAPAPTESQRQIFTSQSPAREQSPFVSEAPAQESAKQSEEEQKPSRGAPDIFGLFNASNPRLSERRGIEPDASVLNRDRSTSGRENLFDGDNLFGDSTPLKPQSAESVRAPRETVESAPVKKQEPIAEKPEDKPAEQPKHVWKKYIRPSLELLNDYPENNNVNTGEIEENKKIIVETLANFRIDSSIANVVVGPAITRYDVKIEDRTNIKNALKYKEAIAMALMKENVSAYLNYSKGAVSYEIPNATRTTVGLKTLLASSQFINAKPGSISFGLGKNIEGQCICPDITKMPHLLVAGTTGSGKSICLRSMLLSMLFKYEPAELRLILVDPKQSEFIFFEGIPHLMINEILYDINQVIKTLNWAIKEMERRYSVFKDMTMNGIAVSNLDEYNDRVTDPADKLPKIVIVLDEFGDLMLQAKKDVESRIIRLVQKSRACGIHLILATQRPSVDCITGLIKSNLPTRIGFKVNSLADSSTIFDLGGAEKLLGMGDMYFRSAASPDLARIQGCFASTDEMQKVTDFVKAHNETCFDQSVSDFINTVEEEATDSAADDGSSGDGSKVDDTFIKALKFCVTSNQASVSMLQRRFPIGYMKACKIIDWMANMNYITQSEGSKPRKVLLSREEFVQKYGDVDD